MSFYNNHKYLFLGLVFNLVFFMLFIVIVIKGWGGNFNICYNSGCFCENMSKSTYIREPQNTWSNLAYIFIGLLLLWKIDKLEKQKPDETNNPLEYASIYSVLYAFLVINIGWGSWLYHATLKSDGGHWDVVAMNMYMAFFLSYNLRRVYNKSERSSILTWILLCVGFTLQEILDTTPWHGEVLFTVLVAIVAGSEMFILLWIKIKGNVNGFHRNWRWFYLGFVIFNAGFAVWNLTNTGDPYCNPDGIQGHLFWHLSTAIATYCFFIYMKSEKKVVSL